MAMLDSVKEETVGFLFNVDVTLEEPLAVQSGEGPVLSDTGFIPVQPTQLQYVGPNEDGNAAQTVKAASENPYATVGRNDECPCGSGKKFKKCHGAPSV